MDTLGKGVFALSVLAVPVSCSDNFFTEPVICYFLDGFLIIYCIIVTGLFFREKFSKGPSVGVTEENGIYQELERPKDADPYEVLDPSKRKVWDTSFVGKLFNGHILTFSGAFILVLFLHIVEKSRQEKET
uniref:T-cell surface glycoprotein CD3 zeta chain-like n=1 Tax=Haplochromis burtoni TaxID=8153 RepID=A0A3Q2WF70_HAPBU